MGLDKDGWYRLKRRVPPRRKWSQSARFPTEDVFRSCPNKPGRWITPVVKWKTRINQGSTGHCWRIIIPSFAQKTSGVRVEKKPVKPNLEFFRKELGDLLLKNRVYIFLYNGVKQGNDTMMLFKPSHVGLSPNKKSTKTVGGMGIQLRPRLKMFQQQTFELSH